MAKSPRTESPAHEVSRHEASAEDRAWVEAVDHHLEGGIEGRTEGRRRARRPRAASRQGRYVVGSALILALLVSPLAVGRTGDSLVEGKRNPRTGYAKRETEIIASNRTYGTRQSNVRDGNGGGAIYGCRSTPEREPCVRGNNLQAGRAFEFETEGVEAGRIEANAAGARPFSTNATGVATGLNADRVDSLDAARVDFRAATGTAPTEILNLGGLVLRASCNAGPDLDVRADTSVADSTLHVSWNRDPGNVPFYRQDNNLDPGASFSLLGTNDDSAQGTLAFTTPAGANVTVTFQSEEGGAFAGATACLFGGTAQGFQPEA
jgi:hypothetical protein